MVVHGTYPLAEPRVTREAQAARRDGWKVEVIALRGGDEPSRELADGVAVTRLPIRHVRGAGIGAMFLEYLGFALFATVIVAARHIKRRYQVVQVHNPPDFLI